MLTGVRVFLLRGFAFFFEISSTFDQSIGCDSAGHGKYARILMQPKKSTTKQNAVVMISKQEYMFTSISYAISSRFTLSSLP